MMASAPDITPDSVSFATTTPPYLDKTNANAIHAALEPAQLRLCRRYRRRTHDR